MSRAFVKEEDQEEAPFIPPRAPLPAGVTNYVTAKGMADLYEEKEELEKLRERASTIDNTNEKRRTITEINGRLSLLEERINSARMIDIDEQPRNEVRFGAKVELTNDGNSQEFQLVGVDEADVNKTKIAFTAPIARAITGKKINEVVELKLGNKLRQLKILGISY
ncbi:transcription elongation factor [Marivirga lumbricoides]|uniref:Transcription elongation factor n=1 Tax=Marivirga lumbricoides TaxID=1046115 RepID=A0ABQ1N9R7_9BACT|nr:transcription elongation factor [Marivirga lumbricoides]